MLDIVPLDWWRSFELFLLLLGRVVGFFVVAPVFGGIGVPATVRAGLIVFTAVVLVGPVGSAAPWPEGVIFEGSPWAYLLIAGELLLGAALGFIVLLFFTAVQIAGQLMDIPLGFGMVNVLDPQTGDHVPVLGQFQFALAMLIFFTVNAHHWLLRALAESYRLIPVGTGAVTGFHVDAIVTTFSYVFTLGARLALPLVAAAFLTDVALAIVSRAVPQINVFITGFPLKVMAGMFVLSIVLPAYVGLLGLTFGDDGEMLRHIGRFLTGR